MKGPERAPTKKNQGKRWGFKNFTSGFCARVKRRDHFKAEAKVQLASDLMKGPEDLP